MTCKPKEETQRERDHNYIQRNRSVEEGGTADWPLVRYIAVQKKVAITEPLQVLSGEFGPDSDTQGKKQPNMSIPLPAPRQENGVEPLMDGAGTPPAIDPLDIGGSGQSVRAEPMPEWSGPQEWADPTFNAVCRRLHPELDRESRFRDRWRAQALCHVLRIRRRRERYAWLNRIFDHFDPNWLDGVQPDMFQRLCGGQIVREPGTPREFVYRADPGFEAYREQTVANRHRRGRKPKKTAEATA